MPARYATYESRQHVQRSVDNMEKVKADPVSFRAVSMKDKFLKQLQDERKHLDNITPPDVDGPTKDAVRLRAKKLSEAWVNGRSGVVPPYPNKRQMEKVTVGAPGQHIEHERFWKNHNIDKGNKIYKVDEKKGQQGLAFELKDHLRTLRKDQEMDNPDIANLEQFRPDGLAQVPLADHPLPRSYGLSLEAKSNYDDAFPDHPKTDVEQKLEAAESPASTQVVAPGELDPTRCQAIKKSDKQQCNAQPLRGKKYCMIRSHRNQFMEF